MTFSEIFDQYQPQLVARIGEHFWLVGVAMLIAAAIAVPAGILLTRQPKIERWVLGFTNAVQTIPSLALFGFLIPLPVIGGIGPRSAIVALVLYALLPIVRNTYTGIKEVDPAVREAALAMGMTDGQILRMVELPLAARTIMAGLRVATVTGVGVATVATLIGAGGLGDFIYRGLQTVNSNLILLGAVPAALMALGADFGLGLIERKLVKGRVS
ncbi:MAG: ABC transporter permease [Bryobacterales bacterium]|nr:ABC transporter permease [Bryobacterales bacterium]